MLDPKAFSVHHEVVRNDVELAFVREGSGGLALLLLHGWPESMRIWWRNIEPLAAAGFEVIVPDLRGFGLSSGAGDGFYDIASHSRDLHALLRRLGHEHCIVSGADWGGAIAQDFSHRFPGVALRQVLFNTLVPVLPQKWDEAGVGGNQLEEVGRASEHMARHGNHADELTAELDSEEKRRLYVRGFYLERKWAAPDNFDEQSADFMAEAFSDAATFRTSLGLYEAAMHEEKRSEAPLVEQPNTIPTLAMLGEADRLSGDHWTARMELGCTDIMGPFVVERAGHFLQWERAQLFNQAVRFFCQDLITHHQNHRA